MPLPIQTPQDGNYGIYALCCEMLYTTAGMELLQVSVANVNETKCFDTFVTHEHDTIDTSMVLVYASYSGPSFRSSLKDLITGFLQSQVIVLRSGLIKN